MERVWSIVDQKYDDIIDQVLYNRGIIGTGRSQKSKENFLHPSFETGLLDPLLLPDMKKAIDRILLAKKNKEKIGIFSDYDADGVPGAALLYRTFRQANIAAEVFTPSRNDGYGLSRKGIDYLFERGCRLILSVDLGIRSQKEALYCQEIGIDLIITDHHLPDKDLPAAFALINPKLLPEDNGCFSLCGCGVAYKVIQALSAMVSEISPAFLKWNLDLVAISTIADMVPLTGENRILTTYGLIVLRQTRNCGLKQMFAVSNINQKAIDPYVVGFQIGPRINSPGRLDHATKSFELLVTEDLTEAHELAEWLDQKNIERQRQMEIVEKDAIKQIEDNNLLQNKLLIVKGDWPKGVLGPPASRLVEKYGRPAIVFSDQPTEAVGSARSVAGINITEVLEAVSGHVKKFGGHRGAAGVSVDVTHFEQFSAAIIKYANENFEDKSLVKKIVIDAIVNTNDLNLELFNGLTQLEPFGVGNPRPVFLFKQVCFKQMRFVGNGGKHLSARVGKGLRLFKAIYFNSASAGIIINSTTEYDVVFNLALDTWGGKNEVSITIIDLKEHEQKE